MFEWEGYFALRLTLYLSWGEFSYPECRTLYCTRILPFSSKWILFYQPYSNILRAHRPYLYLWGSRSSQILPRNQGPSRCPFITPSRSLQEQRIVFSLAMRMREAWWPMSARTIWGDETRNTMLVALEAHRAMDHGLLSATAKLRNGRPARATFVVIRPPPWRPRCCCATINGGRQDCAKPSSSLSPPIRVCARAGRPPTPR
jgi:hypothetical protein